MWSVCTPLLQLDTVCATTLCETRFVLQPCVRHTLYSAPVSDTVCTLLLCKTITPVPDSLCPAPVSDTVLCPCVRCALCQRQCVFHPSDRHSPLCHTVCALPLCHTQFVPCPCVIHSLCPAPVSDALCVRDSVYSTPVTETHPCATQFVPCPHVRESLYCTPALDNRAGIDFILGPLHM